MSRQTVPSHNPAKAAAAAALAPLPKGSIRQMRARFAARDGRPEPVYAKGICTAAPVLIEVIASLPEEFTFDDLRHDARLEFMNTDRLRQQTGLLKRAGQLSLVKRGTHGIPSLYRRLPAFDAAQAPDGPPLTDLEKRYRALRAEIAAPPVTVGDLIEHPSQR